MDARTDARTWATLNALQHSSNGGDIKMQIFFLLKINKIKSVMYNGVYLSVMCVKNFK